MYMHTYIGHYILHFKEHGKFIGGKASLNQGALTRMMPNIGETNPFKIMLYASLIGALLGDDKKEKLSSVYRLSAMRQISDFRTVSDEVVLVSAKTISFDILADKMRWIYFRRL